MAQLETPDGHRVTLAVWPDTLLDMYRANVLTGEALADALLVNAALQRAAGTEADAP